MENEYFNFNLPIQAWPVYEDEENEKGKILDYRILNYMPRKAHVHEILLTEIIGEENYNEENVKAFFNQTADNFINLARQFRSLANGKQEAVYYHNEGT